MPSGTIWATCNVGASNPSDYGLYFQWGDTVGYTADQVGKDEGYKKFSLDWGDYKFGTSTNFTKYKAYGATLELENDAARFHMGGDWHMPTPTQIQELIDNTTSKWIKYDGVKGVAFTSKDDTSKSIFIPAAGNAINGLVYDSGWTYYVWSSMKDSNLAKYGQSLCFISGGLYLVSFDLCEGLSVRGVLG